MPEPISTGTPTVVAVILVGAEAIGFGVPAGICGFMGAVVSLRYISRRTPIGGFDSFLVVTTGALVAGIFTAPIHSIATGYMGITAQTPVTAGIGFLLGLTADRTVPWVLREVPLFLRRVFGKEPTGKEPKA